MSLDDETREALRQRRDEFHSEAARLLLAQQEPEPARRQLAWVETADAVLASDQRRKRAHPWVHRLLATGLLGLICLTMVLLAWILHPSGNALSLTVETDAVSLYLEKDWSLTGHGNKAPEVSRLKVTRLQEVYLGEGWERTDTVTVNGTGIELTSMTLPAGSRLKIETRPDGLDLYLYNGQFEAKAVLTDAEWVLPHKEKRVQSEGGPSETLRIVGAVVGEVGRPTFLELDTGSDWRMSGLRVSALSFEREDPPDSGEVVSALRSATGKFKETNDPILVEAGDRLLLKGLESRRLTLEGSESGMVLTLDGQVDSLRAGPVGFEKELSPTWLEYLTKQQQLALVWGALLFLWGLAWTLRGLW